MGLFTILITTFAILLGLINTDSKKVSVFILILLYLLLAFERSEGDYEGYLLMYAQIADDFGNALTYEPLYVAMTALFAKYGLSFDQMRWILSIFEVLILYFTAKRFTVNTALVLALFMIFPAPLNAELFRFFFGMCLVIYGMQYLIRGNFYMDILIFVVCVTMASLFHTSCWIFLIYLFMLIKNRKQLFLITASIMIPCLALASTGLFFDVLSKLPIRVFVIEKYETGSYSNVTGIIFATLKQFMILSMAFVATGDPFKAIYKKTRPFLNSSHAPNAWMEIFQSRIIDINLVSFFLLIPMYYSASSQRLVHVVIFLNYIALANGYLNGRKRICLFYSVSTAICFLLFLLYIEGNGTIDEFKTHFTEGYLINFFKTISNNKI